MTEKVRVPETEAEYASLCKELLYEINYDASQGSCPERTRLIEEMEAARRAAPFEYRDGVLVRKKAGAS